jgi:hypothetical protein
VLGLTDKLIDVSSRHVLLKRLAERSCTVHEVVVCCILGHIISFALFGKSTHDHA